MNTTQILCAKSKVFTKHKHIAKPFKGPGSRYPLPHGGFPVTGRGPTIKPFPYVPIRDLKLKDQVSGTHDKEVSK